MGKTPKPLRILIHPSMETWPAIQALVAQGHRIQSTFAEPVDAASPSIPTLTDPPTPHVCPATTRASLADFDVVLGPNCWRMSDILGKYLGAAIKEARSVRYPKETT